MILFSVYNRDSFNNIDDRLKDAKDYGNNKCHIVLVGTQCDKVERTISFEEGKSYASSNGLSYFEVSALENFNVEALFQYAADILLLEKNANQGLTH